jgi:hypothetical protein
MAGEVKFLQSPWPDLLAYLVDPDGTEARIKWGEVKASYRNEVDDPGWAWAVWKDGLRFERGDTWGGWGERPRGRIAWSDLRSLIASHPVEMDQIRALADGRGTPHSLGWRWFMLPSICCRGMHQSYYESEREDDYYKTEPWFPTKPNGYADRLNAWLAAWRIVGDFTREPTDLIEWAEALR